MLTKRQSQALHFIHDNTGADGVSPSFKEIMEHMGMRSKANIHRIVHALAERGFISFIPGRARSIKVIGMPGRLANEFLDRMSAQQTELENLRIGFVWMYGYLQADKATRQRVRREGQYEAMMDAIRKHIEKYDALSGAE